MNEEHELSAEYLVKELDRKPAIRLTVVGEYLAARDARIASEAVRDVVAQLSSCRAELAKRDEQFAETLSTAIDLANELRIAEVNYLKEKLNIAAGQHPVVAELLADKACGCRMWQESALRATKERDEATTEIARLNAELAGNTYTQGMVEAAENKLKVMSDGFDVSCQSEDDLRDLLKAAEKALAGAKEFGERQAEKVEYLDRVVHQFQARQDSQGYHQLRAENEFRSVEIAQLKKSRDEWRAAAERTRQALIESRDAYHRRNCGEIVMGSPSCRKECVKMTEIICAPSPAVPEKP